MKTEIRASIHHKFLPLAAATLLLAATAAAPAAVIVQWTFTGYTGADDAPYTASTIDNDVTAGGFTPAAGFGSNGNYPTSNNGIGTATGNPTPEFATKPIGTTNTQALALTNNSYWSFTVAPDANYELDLTSLTFDLNTFNISIPIGYYLASSIDGFSTPIGSVVNSTTHLYANPAISFDLTGASFQNLTTSTEFRLYAWSPSGSNGANGSRWGFDNVTLNGTVAAVPEPSVLGFLAVAVLVGGLRRRNTMTN